MRGSDESSGEEGHGVKGSKRGEFGRSGDNKGIVVGKIKFCGDKKGVSEGIKGIASSTKEWDTAIENEKINGGGGDKVEDTVGGMVVIEEESKGGGKNMPFKKNSPCTRDRGRYFGRIGLAKRVL